LNPPCDPPIDRPRGFKNPPYAKPKTSAPMLDADTKHRIDAARNILVGKVPDPKSQVEQITIALIYKFMDDMDAESELLGGVRSFFVGTYEKYGWAKLMNSGLGGNEILNRYAEAMTELPRHQGLPQLFRDIFKNAYLPYRDPETLKLFLKQIDGFTYDHSERLGDAFEYLLSVLGTQGDAGQFRTPRHMIDFMVALLNPQKHESVLDPACGTAGFLIAAYKHIAAANRDAQGDSTLSQLDRVKLAKNFVGYDISPDMVRLSRVNLYLHGFATPQIDEYDTLTQLDHWGKTVDVVLANPPFMSPKGGIQTHSKFSVQSKRSEVLFVDYMAEHLSPRGRAAIIVPEGIIFQSGSAYKQLRKMLVEQYLVAVISLPAGLFQPYSGVKTSILVLDRALAPTAKQVAFFTITNDGFALNAQRRPIAANDLPQVLADCTAWMQGLAAGAADDESAALHAVDKTKLAASGDYNLSGERYRVDGNAQLSSHPIVAISEICKISTGKKDVNSSNQNGKYPFFTCARLHTYSDEYSFDTEAILISGNGDVGAVQYYKGKFEAYQRTYVLSDWSRVEGRYLYSLLQFRLKEKVSKIKLGNTMPYIKLGMLADFQIPLPPLAIQQAIVAEIERYQTIIDGARAVVDNYQPQIDIDPSWEIVSFCDAPFKMIDGDRGANYPSKEDFSSIGHCLFLNTKNVRANGFEFVDLAFISLNKDKALRNGKLERGDVLLTTRGTIGNTALYDDSVQFEHIRINSGMLIFRPNTKNLASSYLFYYFQSLNFKKQRDSIVSGAAQPQLPIRSLNNVKIPLPPLATQQAIVAQIQAEQALVAANRELITRFEAKIAATLARVWGDSAA
jgi:type I restriction enzyme M protein